MTYRREYLGIKSMIMERSHIGDKSTVSEAS
jgi:hypothetical protein